MLQNYQTINKQIIKAVLLLLYVQVDGLMFFLFSIYNTKL